ncbi:hypothetical protein [Arcobacter vandammei]|nr:hypothetical protein [Arcobacter vandammei]
MQDLSKTTILSKIKGLKPIYEKEGDENNSGFKSFLRIKEIKKELMK